MNRPRLWMYPRKPPTTDWGHYGALALVTVVLLAGVASLVLTWASGYEVEPKPECVCEEGKP